MLSQTIQIPEVFKSQHTFVCGQTQSGKTFYTVESLKKSDLPVFFFNPQFEDTGMTIANKENEVDDIIRHMKKGGKIDYHPSTVRKYAQKELDYIISSFFYKQPFTKEKPFIFAIDECHWYAEQGSKSEHAVRIATGGYKFGFRGVFISQDPARVDKIILRQCSRHIIFKVDPYQKEYLVGKKFDMDTIDAMNGEKEEHKGVLLDFGRIQGIIRV